MTPYLQRIDQNTYEIETFCPLVIIYKERLRFLVKGMNSHMHVAIMDS